MADKIQGYSASPNVISGNPAIQAVAMNQANTQATIQRNAAGGYKSKRKRRRRMYRGGVAGYTEVNSVPNSTAFPTNFSPNVTQQQLVTASIANKVNAQGDAGLSQKGGSKRRNFFRKLFRFTMKNKKTKKRKNKRRKYY
jgi:formate dehydrogenase assembly factor FdhD